MGLFRSLARSAQLAGYFVRFGAELVWRRPATRQQRAQWLHRFCSTALHGLGMPLAVEGEFPAGGAVISNHLSYLDIIIFAAVHPCVFCSKAEIEQWPVLGWMTRMAGTVFVARGRGGSALKARGDMQAAYEEGLPVVFFPEGTTTNGETLLRFHTGLLSQAMQVQMPVTAAAVHYTLAPGQHATVADDVHYWGERALVPHIFRFLGLRGVQAQVRFGAAPIAFSSGTLHRKAAAVEARCAVATLAGAWVPAEGACSEPLPEDEDES